MGRILLSLYTDRPASDIIALLHLAVKDDLVADPGLLALIMPTSGVKACMAAGLRLMSVAALVPPGVPLPARLLPATSFSQMGLSEGLFRHMYETAKPGSLGTLHESPAPRSGQAAVLAQGIPPWRLGRGCASAWCAGFLADRWCALLQVRCSRISLAFGAANAGHATCIDLVVLAESLPC